MSKNEEKAKIFFATSKPPHITENDTGFLHRIICQIRNNEKLRQINIIEKKEEEK